MLSHDVIPCFHFLGTEKAVSSVFVAQSYTYFSQAVTASHGQGAEEQVLPHVLELCDHDLIRTL